MAKLSNGDKILQAGLDVISERGFHDAPVSLIAKRAGLAEGTIYRYYRSKDELISKIYSYTANQYYNTILIGYSAKGTIRERFFHICTAALRYYIDHPRLLRYSDQFTISPFAHEIRTSHSKHNSDDAFVILLLDGIAKNKIKDLPIPNLRAMTFDVIRSIARSHFDGNTLDENLIARSVESCWDAIRRRG